MEAFKSLIVYHLKTYKWFFSIIGLLLIMGGYFYITKNMAATRHAKELVDTKQHYEQQAQLVIAENAREQLTLMQKTFVWAVRSALIRDNLDEVNQYFNELIKEENVWEIVLAGSKGEILVSTNKKHEGRQFTEFYPEVMLQVSDVFFQHQDSVYQVSTPVLSLNTKLGTLFTLYHVDGIQLQGLEETDTVGIQSQHSTHIE